MSGEVDPGANERRNGILVAIGLMLLAFGFTVALTLPTYVDRSNPFWFVGMLVIFGSSLSLIAIVFRWLGLANAQEAFGLPTGSIRTLLAIGVMVLFAVFGLVAMSVDDGGGIDKALSGKPLATAVAPSASAALDAEIKRYERQGALVVVASADAASAVLKIYPGVRAKSAETTDMQKQIVTALVTLLTSVISFYFGSRSVEAARDGQDKGDKPDQRGGATKPAAGAPPSVDAAVKTLDQDIQAIQTRLAALQADNAAEGQAAALAAALAPLVTEAAAIGADRTQFGAQLADVAAGHAEATTLDAPLAALRQRVDACAQRLTDAEALVAKG